MSDPVKRQYRSDVRSAKAAQTRRVIREAAADLFVRQGYTGTSMREVARAAGVAERTVYVIFPSKPALFQHTLGVAVGGDEDDLQVHQRAQMQELLASTDPNAVLAQTVALGADLLDRAGDLIMVGVEAAGSDADMRAMSDAGAKATYAGYTAVARHLADLGALRADLPPTQAADVMYALGSPFTHQLLRRHRRWSARRYRDWLLYALTEQLIRDGC